MSASAITAARRLAQFIERDFDPTNDQSWQRADRLWRDALLMRDARKLQRSADQAGEASEVAA